MVTYDSIRWNPICTEYYCDEMVETSSRSFFGEDHKWQELDSLFLEVFFYLYFYFYFYSISFILNFLFSFFFLQSLDDEQYVKRQFYRSTLVSLFSKTIKALDGIKISQTGLSQALAIYENFKSYIPSLFFKSFLLLFFFSFFLF